MSTFEPCCIKEYPEYGFVFHCVLDFFIQAKERGKIKFLEDIDNIMSELFNINPTYAKNLRLVYAPNSRSKITQKRIDKYFESYKISHINIKLMESECKKNGISCPDEVCDNILLLSTYTLPVSEILNEESKYEVHAKFKSEAKKWIDEIDMVMKNNPALKLSLLMYLHQFRDNELVWWLLATLSTIDEDRVKKWIESFSNVQSEKSISEMMKTGKEMDFLSNFHDKFYRLNEKNLKAEKIYSNITGFDLMCAYRHIDYFKQFSRTPLRQNDILLTYYITATLKQWPQELMLEQITNASRADLPIKFCPVDEIHIDWGTQIAW